MREGERDVTFRGFLGIRLKKSVPIFMEEKRNKTMFGSCNTLVGWLVRALQRDERNSVIT